MSSYNLNTNSPDFVQSNGSAIIQALQNNLWNSYTGQYDNPITVQNDFGAMGVDEAVADSTFHRGVKGEFQYRYGVTATRDEYEY